MPDFTQTSGEKIFPQRLLQSEQRHGSNGVSSHARDRDTGDQAGSHTE